MSTVVEQIKSKLSIVDVVGSYLKLEKAGSNLKARCPFHNEKTASFFVSPSRETYHCFGCDRGGDIFSFVEEIEGLDFRGALKILADKAGVPLKQNDVGADKERDKLFRILREAVNFYVSQLNNSAEAKQYLQSRSVSEKTTKDFEIGVAPNEWRMLTNYLGSKGFAGDLVERAGLSIKSEKGYYDRFRGRIMFPISDSSGRTVGFSGRILPAKQSNYHRSLSKQNIPQNEIAKYVNSPETPVFHKSLILFGFDKAKQNIRKQNRAVLVEGQLDLVLSHQSSVDIAVASSGTSTTRDQLVSIQRLCNVLVFAYDADSAGLAASKKGIDMALSMGFDVKVADLPQGMDPADVIKANPKDWKKRVENAKHVIDYYLHALVSQGLEMREFRRKTSELVLPYIAMLRNAIDQAHFVSETARALNIEEAPIWEELKKMSGKQYELNNQEEKDTTEHSLSPNVLTRKDNIERKILGILLWQKEATKPVINISNVIHTYAEIIQNDVYKVLKLLSVDKKKDLIFEAEVYYENSHNLQDEAMLLLANLKEEVIKEEMVSAMENLKNAEIIGDLSKATLMMNKINDLTKKLNTKHSK